MPVSVPCATACAASGARGGSASSGRPSSRPGEPLSRAARGRGAPAPALRRLARSGGKGARGGARTRAAPLRQGRGEQTRPASPKRSAAGGAQTGWDGSARAHGVSGQRSGALRASPRRGAGRDSGTEVELAARDAADRLGARGRAPRAAWGARGSEPGEPSPEHGRETGAPPPGATRAALGVREALCDRGAGGAAASLAPRLRGGPLGRWARCALPPLRRAPRAGLGDPAAGRRLPLSVLPGARGPVLNRGCTYFNSIYLL